MDFRRYFAILNEGAIMEQYDVLIMGGGLSGLSAAVDLTLLGRKVCLLEQRQYAGGRAYSFPDPVSGEIVDNGQHLMMGCYHATQRYLRSIGTEHLALLQPVLRIAFLCPGEDKAVLSCLRLPAPFHVLSGLLRFNAIPLWERFQMLKVGFALIRPPNESQLDALTADEWLTQLNQSDRSRKFLWDVITIGALNNHPRNVSALMLFRVLHAAFFGQKKNASLLIPSVGLSELFVDPAVKFLRSHGGTIVTGVEAESMKINGTHIHSVQTTEGREFFAESFISAVPWYAVEKIMLINDATHCRGSLADLIQKKGKEKLHDNFHSSPIISLQLRLDRTVLDEEFAAMIDTRVQWVFNKSWKAGKQMSSGAVEQSSSEADEYKREGIEQSLSFVISGAQEFIEMNKEQLAAIAMEDLRSVLPKAKEAKVLHSLVIKEKRATFSPVSKLETFRPGAQTEFKNLFLAGDWTDTGYPATIEGAVLSGKKAAAMVQQYS